MKIEFNTLKQMIFGTIDIWEEDGFVRMCGFSKSQRQLFKDMRNYINKPLKEPA